MAVCIVADYVTMVKPQYIAGSESIMQHLLHIGFFARKTIVAGRCQQARCRSEDSSVAIALDRATLEDEIVEVAVMSAQQTGVGHAARYAVVERIAELSAPGVESKIAQHRLIRGVAHGNHTIVADPCIVGRCVKI